MSGIARGVAVCRDYASKRSVFGKRLNEHPLQIKVLADMEVTFRANLIFLLNLSVWFSKMQAETATLTE